MNDNDFEQIRTAMVQDDLINKIKEFNGVPDIYCTITFSNTPTKTTLVVFDSFLGILEYVEAEDKFGYVALGYTDVITMEQMNLNLVDCRMLQNDKHFWEGVQVFVNMITDHKVDFSREVKEKITDLDSIFEYAIDIWKFVEERRGATIH